ncbi:hypothetical protein ACFQX4_19240 [Roseomonas sp. GCM10028921]
MPAMDTEEMTAAVRAAWSGIPAPPAEDLQYVAWGWGEAAAEALVGVAPVDVDVASAGFQASTPLLDLPPAAAAAYLGSFLLSLLRGLSMQERTGIFPDILTRAHVVTCLTHERFWREAIRPHLPPECRQVLRDLADYLAPRADMLGVSPEQMTTILARAAEE